MEECLISTKRGPISWIHSVHFMVKGLKVIIKKVKKLKTTIKLQK